MSETRFEKFVNGKALELEKVDDLGSLFGLWKQAHKKEVEDLIAQLDDQNIGKDEFEQKIYYKKGNTISSHFAQFFEKECQNCSKSKETVEKAWKLALENAFNMDGAYENYDVKDEGYRYICLLKEANDSKKMCINDYLEGSDIVNEWVVNNGQGVCGRKYKSDMLHKLNEAFFQLILHIWCN